MKNMKYNKDEIRGDSMTLGENITKFRKEKRMTQEMLADSLGVTFAAVSKWERGVATPDLDLIISMATIFQVSVDTLIGYEMKDNSIKEAEKRVNECIKEMKYQEAVQICNSMLARYPNNFYVVYNTAEVYYLAAVKFGKDELICKCIDLYEHAIILLNQNDDPAINETSIRSRIALCYISTGDARKGIEMLKKCNVNDSFSPKIAYSYVTKLDYENSELEPYLISAFNESISSTLLTTFSYLMYFDKNKQYKKGIKVCNLVMNYLTEMKEDKESYNYFEKFIPYLYTWLALFEYKLGENTYNEKLQEAKRLAIIFDKAPTNIIKDLIFCVPSKTTSIGEDNLGNTAVLSCLKIIEKYKEMVKEWELIEV
jgi:transcriptional regulator with XRE-family HTH domain